MALLDDARAWLARGFTPLPVRADGTKAPGLRAWKELQTRKPTDAELVSWFPADAQGIGLLTGATSGNLEMIELEGRAVREGVLPRLIAAFADHGRADLWALLSSGYAEVTPSGGLHYYVRIGDGAALPNTKLARRPSTAEEIEVNPHARVEVLIETRGEGGFSVIAPSRGTTHPSGRPWSVLVGSWDTVPTVTAADRDAIHAIAATLDAVPVRESSPATPTARTTPEGVSPGDDYNARGDWDVLLRHGWQVHHRSAGTTYWTRPGKSLHEGVSATTGHEEDADRFYCFSSSTPFDPEVPYSRHGVLAVLEHGGDHSAAAKALAREGYGTSRPDPLASVLTVGAPAQTLTPAAATSDKGADVLTFPSRPAAATSASSAPLTIGTSALAVAPSDITLARYGPTEDGLAQALVDAFGSQLRYCPQRGLWLTWSGARWEWDEKESHRERAKDVARNLPENKTWERFRSRALSASGIAAVIALARTDPRIVVHLDDLDARPWELNTPGGIIDMRTGILAPASRESLHTRTTTVTPDYESPAPTWLRFLDDTFGGDASMIGFVQRFLGVSAIGQVLEQQLPFAFGPGANGKSTLMNIVMRILGKGREGYSIALDSEALMVRRHSEHPAELAALAGARMVVSSEIEDGQRFAEARVKQLTGGDAISARFMRGNPFTFTPTHTLWLVGNHKPGTTAGGPAFWRRIRLIPFDHTVPDERRDSHLEDKLMAEAPQILAWIAEGAADYGRRGLDVPSVVVDATKKYAADQDSVTKFVQDMCMKTPAGRVKASELRTAYERFCSDTGDLPVSAKRLGEQLRDQHGVELVKSSGGARVYAGISLYASDEDEPDWRDR